MSAHSELRQTAAVDTVLPVSDPVVFGAPYIGENEIDEVVDTLRSGWIGTGPKVADFESRFADFVNTRFAVGTNSGTAALHLALLLHEVGPGDEVLTTPMTFVATANVIEHCGATPVFVDVRPEDGNINPEEINAHVSERTKAIMPVHYAGALADVRAIRGQCPQLPMVVDAAHAVEARYASGASSAGEGANCTAYSFYVTKNLVMGEGGVLATDREEHAAKARALRLHGLDHDAWTRHSASGYATYDLDYPGFKYNMTDLQASLGVHQLARIDRALERRAEIWAMYNEAFVGLEGVVVPPVALAGNGVGSHARHLYTLWFDWDALGLDRPTLASGLNLEGIGTGWHFRALHLYSYYRKKYGYKPGSFPIAESIADRTVSIPLSPALSDSDVERVIEAVWRVVRRTR